MADSERSAVILSAGSSAATAVLRALQRGGFERVVLADINPSSSLYLGQFVSECIQSPRSLSPDFGQWFDRHIPDNALIVSLTDDDQLFLSRNHSGAPGHRVFNGLSPSFVELSTDKRQYNALEPMLDRRGLCLIPEITTVQGSRLRDALDAQCVSSAYLKPACGRSSQNNLDFSRIQDDTAFVLQPALTGRSICVDIVADAPRGWLQLVQREELTRNSAGQGLSARWLHLEAIEAFARDLVDEYQLCGYFNIEFLWRSNELYLLDINPRLSAGAGYSEIWAGYLTNVVGLLAQRSDLGAPRAAEAVHRERTLFFQDICQ